MSDSTELFVIYKAFKAASGEDKRRLLLEMLLSELRVMVDKISSGGVLPTEEDIGMTAHALRLLAGLCDEAQDSPKATFSDLFPWSADPDKPT